MVQTLVPIGVAAREVGISRERLKFLADAGRLPVVRDVLGRRFVEAEDLNRLRRQRQAQTKTHRR